MPAVAAGGERVGAAEIHRLTSYAPGTGYPADPRKLTDWAGPMREPKPQQFKGYPDAPVVPLPRDVAATGPTTVAALAGSVGARDDFGVEDLAQILFLSAGVVRSREREGSVEWFRAAGSSGNLSPLEVYIVAGPLSGLPAGVYQYQSVAHGLVKLRPGDHRARVAQALDIPRGAVGAATFVISGLPWRAGWKYEERSFRNLYRDAGTMLSQLIACSAAHGPELFLGFVDRELTDLLDLAGPHEFPLAAVTVGPRASAADAPPLTPAPPGSVGAGFKVFPLVVAAQAEGALSDARAVTTWRTAARTRIVRRSIEPTVGALASDEILPLTIRRRGSARRFGDGTAASELLTWALPVASSTRGDFLARASSLLDHHLLVHAVAGFAPGVYRSTGGGLMKMREADCRDDATRLCLEQPLAGSGALAVYHVTPLDDVIATLGDRGYRAALLEAGMVSGRLHLAAQLLGLGATGLTFYDDEVRRFMPTEDDPLLVTAVGHVAYRPRTGGLPGRPAELRPAPAM